MQIELTTKWDFLHYESYEDPVFEGIVREFNRFDKSLSTLQDGVEKFMLGVENLCGGLTMLSEEMVGSFVKGSDSVLTAEVCRYREASQKIGHIQAPISCISKLRRDLDSNVVLPIQSHLSNNRDIKGSILLRRKRLSQVQTCQRKLNSLLGVENPSNRHKIDEGKLAQTRISEISLDHFPARLRRDIQNAEEALDQARIQFRDVDRPLFEWLMMLDAYRGDLYDSLLQTLKYLQHEFLSECTRTLALVLPPRMEFRPLIEMTPEELKPQVDLELDSYDTDDEPIILDLTANLLKKWERDGDLSQFEKSDEIDPLSLVSLTAHGFDEELATKSLRLHQNNTQAALETLLNNPDVLEQMEADAARVRHPTSLKWARKLKAFRQARTPNFQQASLKNHSLDNQKNYQTYKSATYQNLTTSFSSNSAQLNNSKSSLEKMPANDRTTISQSSMSDLNLLSASNDNRNNTDNDLLNDLFSWSSPLSPQTEMATPSSLFKGNFPYTDLSNDIQLNKNEQKIHPFPIDQTLTDLLSSSLDDLWNASLISTPSQKPEHSPISSLNTHLYSSQPPSNTSNSLSFESPQNPPYSVNKYQNGSLSNNINQLIQPTSLTSPTNYTSLTQNSNPPSPISSLSSTLQHLYEQPNNIYTNHNATPNLQTSNITYSVPSPYSRPNVYMQLLPNEIAKPNSPTHTSTQTNYNLPAYSNSQMTQPQTTVNNTHTSPALQMKSHSHSNIHSNPLLQIQNNSFQFTTNLSPSPLQTSQTTPIMNNSKINNRPAAENPYFETTHNNLLNGQSNNNIFTSVFNSPTTNISSPFPPISSSDTIIHSKTNLTSIEQPLIPHPNGPANSTSYQHIGALTDSIKSTTISSEPRDDTNFIRNTPINDSKHIVQFSNYNSSTTQDNKQDCKSHFSPPQNINASVNLSKPLIPPKIGFYDLFSPSNYIQNDIEKKTINTMVDSPYNLSSDNIYLSNISSPQTQNSHLTYSQQLTTSTHNYPTHPPENSAFFDSPNQNSPNANIIKYKNTHDAQTYSFAKDGSSNIYNPTSVSHGLSNSEHKDDWKPDEFPEHQLKTPRNEITQRSINFLTHNEKFAPSNKDHTKQFGGQKQSIEEGPSRTNIEFTSNQSSDDALFDSIPTSLTQSNQVSDF